MTCTLLKALRFSWKEGEQMRTMSWGFSVSWWTVQVTYCMSDLCLFCITYILLTENMLYLLKWYKGMRICGQNFFNSHLVHFTFYYLNYFWSKFQQRACCPLKISLRASSKTFTSKGPCVHLASNQEYVTMWLSVTAVYHCIFMTNVH